MPKNNLLRTLPKVDESIAQLRSTGVAYSSDFVLKKSVQTCIARERQGILAGKITEKRAEDSWHACFLKELKERQAPNLRRMINGTGVVIHTNLGRSLLSSQVAERLAQTASYYSNLEFDLATGKRGSRYSLVEDTICELTGAEAALVVNNNAAAVFLALDALCRGTEVIVSRGQLVEIGGSFRIPDVMARSGADLVEVGATNRTHLYDYEDAISEQTSMLLRVHTSNFRIIGFTSEVPAEEMVGLARKKNLLTMEDLGSGSLIDLTSYGFPKEPTVQELVKAGVDVVTFSGDKLLGGPQAGIIVGSKSVVERIKKSPMNRAFRVDKFTLAALEVVLRSYYDSRQALQEIPTLRMLTTGKDVLLKRARRISRRLSAKLKEKCTLRIVPTMSRVGGGAFPEHDLASWAVAFRPEHIRLSEIEKRLRKLNTPIIGRLENEKFLLDVRTIQDDEVGLLCSLLLEFFLEAS
ncbi:L-seryl-tRNA(Sec) selenium transferase [Desulfotalea psychrophila]|uniref:L-seryl-tRNA(Sec) selenium transferase n=1 Tax=Desulfotalea psychrophila (strain LSv54 / DSM 12343) TaxID=177439 RepID=SELA_DESPS|nr:L-seryl-tRNA(Sec) selenium transferase [Desulfotalea psychrophila]Q6AMK5.1 RecName: Full=L-seryl-tRNA(Sec) selenium transferase; AltName: Full=Selenocysteine synthase; Short=Sec synthase; AltName: Full=Selenocysteinyl-tRNA(Sec) synthase [Desulfotalea psychrophila LSv54]CAG36420.1 probable L-seryl-tRNA selenium transferase [Desulfotalea psychrophila LSv54]